MNTTLWNSSEEVAINFSVGMVSIFVHVYAVVICFAIIDYQKEKPVDEKGPMDVLITDLMYAQMRIIFFSGFAYHISLFSTPIIYESFVYWVAYLGVFLVNVLTVSYLGLLWFFLGFLFYCSELLLSALFWQFVYAFSLSCSLLWILLFLLFFL